MFFPLRKRCYQEQRWIQACGSVRHPSTQRTTNATAGKKSRLENKNPCADCREKIKAPAQGCSALKSYIWGGISSQCCGEGSKARVQSLFQHIGVKRLLHHPVTHHHSEPLWQFSEGCNVETKAVVLVNVCSLHTNPPRLQSSLHSTILNIVRQPCPPERMWIY